MDKVTLKAGTRGPALTSSPHVTRNVHAQYSPKGGTLISTGKAALAARAKQVLKGVSTATDALT